MLEIDREELKANLNQNTNANADENENVNEVSNFIWDAIDEDIRNERFDHNIHTRFPPEPNGYLHIGHAKAICIDFETGKKYGGLTNLRFDDTNPSKEDVEYVDAIKEDIHWLGYDWDDRMFYASSYFDKLYECAIVLIKKGKAYVCDLTPEQMREYRGTLTQPGKNSPYRDRSIEENLELFENMKNGMYEEGEKVLRAKIDMSSPNINMRDPAIYRIMKANHHRTGDKWCIYPMYDFAHPLSDSIEGITHSLCSLEFENHRPLYNWVLEEVDMPCKTRQMEFARLNLTHTVMSKRTLLQMVNEGIVSGWDDPRMPTLCGLRRRGFTAHSVRDFCNRIGVAKAFSVVDYSILEHCLREDLNETAMRVMAVLKPLRVVIDNYPEGKVEEFEVENNPNRPEDGTRTVRFSREIFIEQDDFVVVPPNRKYFRLAPDKEVRLKGAYIAKCVGYETDDDGNVTLVHCEYDPESSGGSAADGRKIKGTIHWVGSNDCADIEVRLYDRLFTDPDPAGCDDWHDVINPDSVTVYTDCKIEKDYANADVNTRFQFIRNGYFCADKESTAEHPVFNKTVGLKDTWGKLSKE